MDNLFWILALVLLTLILPALTYWALLPRPRIAAALPTDWALSPRPVFNTNERRAYRALREALPQHIVLSKLPLVRFCQPVDATQTRYWYDLLGAIHVGFAICSANGRVLAAIDLELDRGTSRRLNEIKQSVLSACRVRYLRCPPDQLPSLDELKILVPQSTIVPAAAGQALPVPQPLNAARQSLVSTVASRRAQRTTLWHDATSSAFQDSFFAPDSRFDSLSGLEFPTAAPAQPSQATPGSSGRAPSDSDVAGIVVDHHPVGRPQMRGA